jgi:hypothetical protein
MRTVRHCLCSAPRRCPEHQGLPLLPRDDGLVGRIVAGAFCAAPRRPSRLVLRSPQWQKGLAEVRRHEASWTEATRDWLGKGTGGN